MRIKFMNSDTNIIISGEYTNINEVEPYLYKDVIYINCHDHKLTSVEFITRFPNLKTLIASNNFLTSIPDHNKIQILDVNTNKLRQLGYYPKLIKLYAFNNLITNYNVPNMLFELDISNNRLSNLNFNKNQIFSLFNINYNYLHKHKKRTKYESSYVASNLSIICE